MKLEFFKTTQMSNSIKVCHWESSCPLWTDGERDEQK